MCAKQSQIKTLLEWPRLYVGLTLALQCYPQQKLAGQSLIW